METGCLNPWEPTLCAADLTFEFSTQFQPTERNPCTYFQQLSVLYKLPTIPYNSLIIRLLYHSDFNNHRVRKIAPNEIVTTFAGTGTPGSTGDGEPATSAELNVPYGIAFMRPEMSRSLRMSDNIVNMERRQQVVQQVV